jgi:uncharacterized membrane protein YdjX (TVP38/TMEM64 family)
LNYRAIILACLIAAGLLLLWTQIPVSELILGFAGWMSDLGLLGLVAYLVLYVGVTLAMGPAWALSVAAGVAFGLYAVALVLPSSLTAAVVAFVVARHFARERVAPMIERRARLAAVDRAIAENGLKAVILLRLSPLLPFGLKSYLLSLSHVGLRDYTLGTAIGILPGATLYVSFGAAGRVAATGGPQSVAEWAMLVVGLAATASFVWLIQRESSKKLREMGVT